VVEPTSADRLEFIWQFKKIDQVAAVLPDRSRKGPGQDKTKTE